MASAGGVGIDIDVARVPLREADMEPFEVMVSESQERMLAVVEPDDVGAVLELCERWEVGGAAIGEVTDSGHLRVLRDGELVGDMPVSALVDELPPLRPRAGRARRWVYGNRATLADGSRRRPATAARPARLPEHRLEALGLRAVRLDRRLADASAGPSVADAAVLQLPEAGTAIAVSIDGNGRRVACDPYAGTVEAVLECAQNLACVGAEPLGLTNCLNFGNPEKPTVAWQLDRSIQGLADACEALGVPVVGGNVSLYNETPEGPIYPTPVVGMVGELPSAEAAPVGSASRRRATRSPCSARSRPRWRARSWRSCAASSAPGSPELELAAVEAAIAAVRDAVRAGSVASAHDVSDGGLACALAESAIAGGIGCRVDLDPLVELRGGSGESALFGEGPGGFVLGGERAALEALASGGVEVLIVGEVGGEQIAIEAAELSLSLPARRGEAGLGFAAGARRGLTPEQALPCPLLACLSQATACAPDHSPGLIASKDLTERPPFDDRDGPRDECGVFGVYAPGTTSPGSPTSPSTRSSIAGRSRPGSPPARAGTSPPCATSGLVSQVFDEEKLRALDGDMAIGHVRYSTTGGGSWENAQPVWRDDGREVALAHNGNLTNAVELYDELRERGPRSAAPRTRRSSRRCSPRLRPSCIEDAVADVMPRLEGAYSTVVMTKHAIVAFRDPNGVRPLSLGQLGDRLRGRLGELRVRHHRRRAAARGRAGRDGLAERARDRDPPGDRGRAHRRICVFEHIYFSRPDTPARGQGAAAGRAAGWARSSGARRRSTPTW